MNKKGDILKNYLEAGKIVSTHALKGEVKVESYCNSNNELCTLKTLYLDDLGQNKLNVISSRVFKNISIIKFDSIDSIEKAETMIDKILYLDRKDLKLNDNQYFIQDIIDCKVFDIDTNVCYGQIIDVTKTGANDVYHVKSYDNQIFLIPVIEDVIIKIDIEKKSIHIKPLKGLFDL